MADLISLSEQLFDTSTPETARYIKATALSKSKNGKVKVDIGGGNIDVLVAGSVSEGDSVALLVQNGRVLGIGGMGFGDVLSGQIDTLNVKAAYIDQLTANNVTAANLAAVKAYIDSLEAASITADTLKAANAYVTELGAQGITADTLKADHASIADLEANSVTTDTLNAEIAKVNDVVAKKVDTDTLNANLAEIDTVLAGKVDTTDLEANYVKTTELDTDVANIALANMDTATVKALQSKKAIVTNAMIADAAIDDAKVLELSGNKITTGELDASKVVVTNLNAKNITTGTLKVGGVEINVDAGTANVSGKAIEDGAITTDKLSQEVQDEIDGAIETWSVTAIPTDLNEPEVNWTTDAEKKKHVGDVAYVVNSSSEQSGYMYRYGYDTTSKSYVWTLIKDTDVTAALQKVEEVSGNLTKFEQESSTYQEKTDDSIRTLQNRTTTLETDVGTKVDVDEFADYQQSVDENISTLTEFKTITEGELETVSQDVSSLKQTASSLSSTITSVQKTANAAKSAAATAQSTADTAKSNAAAAQSTADSAKSATETLKTSVSNLEQDAESIAARVSTVETTASNAETLAKGGVSKVEVQYAQNQSTTTAPTSGWSTTAPTWKDGYYVWQKTVTTYKDGTTTESDPTCISGAKGTTGATGAAGADGVGYKANLIIGSADGGTDYALGSGTWVDGGWSGHKAVATNRAWNGAHIHTKDIAQRNNLAAGTTMTASIYVSCDSDTAQKVVLSAHRFNTATNTQTGSSITPTLESGKWYRWVLQFKTNEIDTMGNIARFECRTSTDFNILWSCPMLTVGTDVPEWSYAASELVGNGVSSITPQYYLSTSATECTGGSWSTTMPTWTSGTYIWTRSHVVYTDGTSADTTPVLDTQYEALVTRTANLEVGVDSIKSDVSAVKTTAASALTKATKVEQTATSLTTRISSVETTTSENQSKTSTLETLIRQSGDGVEVAKKINGVYTSAKTTLSDSGVTITNQDDTQLASYGTTTTIGNPSSYNTYINNSGVNIRNGTTIYSNFGSTVTIGQTGSSSKNLYIDSNGIHVRTGTTNNFNFTSSSTTSSQTSTISAKAASASKSNLLQIYAQDSTGSYNATCSSYTTNASSEAQISANKGDIGSLFKMSVDKGVPKIEWMAKGSANPSKSYDAVEYVDGMLASVSIYDNASGNTGTITLDQTACNFKMLVVCYKYADDVIANSCTIWNNYQNTTADASSAIAGDYWGAVCRTRLTIVNTTISQLYNYMWRSDWSSASSSTKNRLKIYKVIGYK